MCLLVIIAGAEFLFQGTIHVGIAGILLAIWLFLKRPAFDRPFSLGSLQHYVDDALGHAKRRTGALRERARARREATVAASQDLGRKTGWEQRAEEGQTLTQLAHDATMLKRESDRAAVTDWGSVPEGREG